MTHPSQQNISLWTTGTNPSTLMNTSLTNVTTKSDHVAQLLLETNHDATPNHLPPIDLTTISAPAERFGDTLVPSEETTQVPWPLYDTSSINAQTSYLTPPSATTGLNPLQYLVHIHDQANMIVYQLAILHQQMWYLPFERIQLKNFVCTVNALLVHLLTMHTNGVDPSTQPVQTQIVYTALELAKSIYRFVDRRVKELDLLDKSIQQFHSRAQNICKHPVYSRPRRHNHPPHAIHICRTWLNNHRAHPYPTPEEKRELCHQSGLSLSQLNDWFVNARRRYLHRSDPEDGH
jgi:hypothetical protein